jgi:SagB-type dehydrogenase family enzyme
VSAALDYHYATNVPAGGTDEDEGRTLETHPAPFKDYGDAEGVPIESSVAGPILRDGAAVVRSVTHTGFPGERRVHFRAYSSAGALYPVEAYVAAPTGLFSFEPLTPALVRVAGGDARTRVAEAAAVDADVEAFVVLTGIPARTGWKYMERGYRHVWWDAGTMLANLLALAAADDLRPRLLTAFADRELNDVLRVDGVHEYALAVLALGTASPVTPRTPDPPRDNVSQTSSSARFPLAEKAHAASSLPDAAAVRSWRAEIAGDEPKLAREELVRALRRRGSVRAYASTQLPRGGLAELLAWSEAPIPADAPRVVRQVLTVAAVDGLAPGIYDAELGAVRELAEAELRERVGFAAMEQEHPRDAAVNVFQLADVADVVARLGDRGYRWAQLEAGIRAGRLQIGAFMRGWGAAASTFFDEEVSQLLETREAPMLMVAVGPR